MSSVCALRDDMAAFRACLRAHFNQPIGLAERICVSWSTSRTELPSSMRSCITPVRPTMFAGCKPMEGSSSTYKNAGGAVAYGTGKLHALALARGKRGGGAVERQVAEP